MMMVEDSFINDIIKAMEWFNTISKDMEVAYTKADEAKSYVRGYYAGKHIGAKLATEQLKDVCKKHGITLPESLI